MKDRRELGALLHLALPLIASNIGNQLMGFVDTAMVGRLGAAALGGTGIGNSIFFSFSVVAMGCVLGMDPLVGQAVGAGEQARARRVLWHGLRVAAYVCPPIMAIIALAPLGLGVLGVDAETAANARTFLIGRTLGVIPLVLIVSMRSYLQARGATRAIVEAAVVGNIVNFLADAVLIYGDGALHWVGLPGIGLPALGVLGAGLASTLASFCMLGIYIVTVRALPAPPDPERRRRDPALLRAVFRLGLPIGLQLLAEVSAFGIVSVLSGRIGALAAAANQIALSLASMTFMVPFGVASATAVRVGLAVGRDDTPAARRAGLVGLGASACFMSFAALAFLLVPGPLARVLTNKEDIIAAAVPLIHVAAVFQLSDGTQVVSAGALRGAGDTLTSLLGNLIGYFVIGLPLAVVLAFPLHLGSGGLWWGLTAGLTTVAATLALRFLYISKRRIVRV